MRCKSCKKKIENENLYRCPHCGKPLPKKKEKDRGELISIYGFFAVSFVFVVMNFFGLFFECSQYDSATMIIAIVVYLIALPFVFGNYKGLNRSVADAVAVVLSVPFIVNWIICFAQKSEYFAVGTYPTVYYFSVLVSIVLIDMIMVLKAFGTIKSGEIAKWLCLGIGAAEAIFTIVFYSGSNSLKAVAIAIVAINAFMPGYISYHIISRDSKI